MCYTTAMPILYLAGFLICLNMYWVDKFLFLKHYKKPPLYTKELIMSAVDKMEYGVVLHLFFGLFMISNEQTFVYN